MSLSQALHELCLEVSHYLPSYCKLRLRKINFWQAVLLSRIPLLAPVSSVGVGVELKDGHSPGNPQYHPYSGLTSSCQFQGLSSVGPQAARSGLV